jgi:ribosomal protein L24p/L26e, archaeal/eukaryotic
MTKNYSKHWKSSSDAQKQRKYRENAPLHVKDSFLRARLSDGLQEEHDVKQIRVRKGDTVRIERGDHAGIEGEIRTIDRDRERITIDGAETTKIDGSAADYPIHPSNVTITAIDDEDQTRFS